jgi:hypothetical protein
MKCNKTKSKEYENQLAHKQSLSNVLPAKRLPYICALQKQAVTLQPDIAFGKFHFAAMNYD